MKVPYTLEPKSPPHFAVKFFAHLLTAADHEAATKVPEGRNQEVKWTTKWKTTLEIRF